jgi:hypothetical protein
MVWWSRRARRQPAAADDGPIIAGIGIALNARAGTGGSYWTTFFPAAVVLGFGMAVTVAPLTTTVMAAVKREHAGVASGINNAVSRVAGLLAIAVFGVVLVRTFDARVQPDLARLHLTESVRTALDRELPKMGGADVKAAVPDDSSTRASVHDTIARAFVRAFRVVVIGAAGVALAAAIFGALLPRSVAHSRQH